MNIPWKLRLAAIVVGGLGGLVALQNYLNEINTMPSATQGADPLLASMADVGIYLILAIGCFTIAGFAFKSD